LTRALLFLVLALPVTATAEVVVVKRVGDVDLSRFDCTPISESELLRRVCYDEPHRYLVAQIGDEYYDACDVGPKEVDGLMESEHVVAYYNQHLRVQHKCTAERGRQARPMSVGRSAR